MNFLIKKDIPILGTLVLGVLFALIWSLSFVATKTALQSVPPAALAATRLLLAGIIVAVFNFAKIYHFFYSLSGTSLRRLICAGLMSQTVYLTASYWSLVHLPTSIVNIVVSALPLLTIPISFALLGETVRISNVIAFLFSMIGVSVTLLSRPDLPMENISEYGVAASVLLISVVALAIGNVLIKPMISAATLFPICAIQFLSSGITSLVVSVALHEPIPQLTSLMDAGLQIVFLSLIGSIFGTFAWFKVLERLPANAASSFFLLTPIFGIFFGWAFFMEPITTAKVTGVLVISSAILIRAGASFFARLVEVFSSGPRC